MTYKTKYNLHMDLWILYIYWIYFMLGLSGLAIIGGIYEIFQGDK